MCKDSQVLISLLRKLESPVLERCRAGTVGLFNFFPLPWWEGLAEGDIKLSPYSLHHTLQILKYIIIPKSYDLKSLAS